MPERPPSCVVLAGPNGSGKTTAFRLSGASGEFVNSDDIAKRLSPNDPESAAFTAGKIALRRLGELIAQGKDFTFETTLSGGQPLAMMRLAVSAGHRVSLAFVCLSDPDLNVARVAARVAMGGHRIPEAIIRRRFDTSLARLGDAIKIAHAVAIFDNSGDRPALLVEMTQDAIIRNRLEQADAFHRRLAGIVAGAIGAEAEKLLGFAGPIRHLRTVSALAASGAAEAEMEL